MQVKTSNHVNVVYSVLLADIVDDWDLSLSINAVNGGSKPSMAHEFFSPCLSMTIAYTSHILALGARY